MVGPHSSSSLLWALPPFLNAYVSIPTFTIYLSLAFIGIFNSFAQLEFHLYSVCVCEVFCSNILHQIHLYSYKRPTTMTTTAKQYQKKEKKMTTHWRSSHRKSVYVFLVVLSREQKRINSSIWIEFCISVTIWISLVAFDEMQSETNLNHFGCFLDHVRHHYERFVCFFVFIACQTSPFWTKQPTHLATYQVQRCRFTCRLILLNH